jgi:hypothetical protein
VGGSVTRQYASTRLLTGRLPCRLPRRSREFPPHFGNSPRQESAREPARWACRFPRYKHTARPRYTLASPATPVFSSSFVLLRGLPYGEPTEDYKTKHSNRCLLTPIILWNISVILVSEAFGNDSAR